MWLQCTGYGEQGRDDARRSKLGPKCWDHAGQKGSDCYCECDGKTLEGFKPGDYIRMGFLFKESFQLLRENKNGRKEVKRLRIERDGRGLARLGMAATETVRSYIGNRLCWTY